LSQALLTSDKTTKTTKLWDEYTPLNKRKKLQQLASNVNTALSFAENDKFTPTETHFLNNETNERLCIDSNGKFKECTPMAEQTTLKEKLFTSKTNTEFKIKPIMN